MVFKRILFTAVALFIGLTLGILGAPVIIPRLGLPAGIGGTLMIALPCALIVAIAVYLIAGRILVDIDKMKEAETRQMQRRWAWLKPAGLALRSPFPINKNQVIIGRDIKCDVLLLNDSISRRHAEIVREGLGWRIRDLGSSNGTFINGQHVKDALLNEGDLITLGDINMTFQAPTEPMPTGSEEEVLNFQSDPEAIIDFDSTAVQQYKGSGTQTISTQAMGGTIAMGNRTRSPRSSDINGSETISFH